MRKIYDFIIKTRLHVGAIYFFVCYNIIEGTAHVNPTNYLPVIVSFTIWHFALYLFDRAYDANLDYLNNPSESLKGKWTKYFLYFSVFIAFLPLLILFYFSYSIIPYLFLLPITFFYNLRVFSQQRAIKHFTLLKNLYSAIFIWPFPIAIILHYYVGMPNSILEIMIWFWSFVAYVLMGEIIWDMRDVDGDREEKIMTIPVVFGLLKTRFFLFILLALTIIINFVLFENFNYILVLFYSIYILISSPKLPKWLFHFPLFLSLFYYIFVFIRV
ncbi:MAG: UbiA family prenyltransferase [Ignavibacteriales bacterium]|nr:UbiA family prenyltransferase [Ignavibacteriales bacterium]